MSTSKSTVASTSSSCTCCKCEHTSGCKRNQGICIVEGSASEKCQSRQTPTVSKAVWAKVKPPSTFGMQQPAVSARRTEIVRAQLTRDTKSKKDASSLPPNKNKTNLRQTKSKISHTKHTMSTVTH